MKKALFSTVKVLRYYKEEAPYIAYTDKCVCWQFYVLKNTERSDGSDQTTI